jgi:hypothetical protein
MTYQNPQFDNSGRPRPRWQQFTRKVSRIRHGNPLLLLTAYTIGCFLLGLLFWALRVGAEPYMKSMGILGLAFYLLLNAGQLLWILSQLDRLALWAAIEQSQDTPKLPESDNPAIQGMRDKAEMVPFFYIVYAGYIALGCYVAEIIYNWTAFPIVKDWGRFWAKLAIGQLDVTWENLARMLFSVLSIESLVIALVCVGGWIYLHNKGREKEA